MFVNTAKTVLDSWVADQIGSNLKEFPKVILNYQSEMRSQIVAFASSKSVFYRDSIGMVSREWQYIPFTTSEDLKTRGKEMLCSSQDDIERVVTLETSGTTGAPKRLYFTKNDQNRSIDYFRIGMDSFTKAQDKVLILLPCGRDGSIGKLLGEALKLSGKIPFLHGVVKDLAETHKMIKTVKPDIIVGIPFQVLALVKYGMFIGEEITTVKKILLSTDYVSETLVQTIKKYWQCEVFRYYGMTESGFGGGIECTRHEGYHLYESDFYIEIIDPVTGTCLPDGEMGEVVITTLKREGMPLIRYRTGDQSRFIPEPCGCGSMLKRLDVIKTRLSGCIQLYSGDEITKGEVDDVLLDLKSLMDYKIQYERMGNQDVLYLELYYLVDAADCQVIIERLKGIDAIQKTLKDNKLKMDLKSIIVNVDYCPHPAKRRIEA